MLSINSSSKILKLGVFYYCMSKRRKKEPVRAVVGKMDDLLAAAKVFVRKNGDLADKYVQKIRRIGMKNKVSVPKAIKRQYCSNCKTLFVQGKNVRVRTQTGKVVYYCLKCKKYTRIPYK